MHGLAHITGGGLQDNVPRVLPKGCAVEIETGGMLRPPIFDLLLDRARTSDTGAIDRDEAYRVFNMGFGMVVFVAEGDVESAVETLRAAGEEPKVVGRVVVEQAGTPRVRLAHGT